ncbi:retrovirus-related pol polyprotein from transposon TNT 1-94 [Tanacetum coccineum]|uniref:Retrovirus-related pol polyprotein from transposon TNT 1-94 n=1 Tax=Tanacetum coccineum TaxID=301880 RepID=A0ABQ4ZHP7_9ASTR
MQLCAEQAFWLPLSNPKSEQLDIIQTPVEIEVSKELPKISLVKTSFQKLKNHLASFDKVVKVRTTPDAIIKGSWGFKHTKKVFKEEVIPFINSLQASFKDFENGIHSKLNEVKMVFNQMEAAVDQYVMNIVTHVDYVLTSVIPADNKCLVDANLESERLIQENDHLFELLLSQDIVYIYVNSFATLTNYAKIEQHYIDEYSEDLMLKVELAKKEHMEVLVYVTNTCPSLTKPSEKLVVVTPLNKNRKVRFAEPATSSSNTQKQLQPSSPFTKNNRISQTTNSNSKNKVEDHPRSVKSNLNKKKRVIEPICNANVKHTMLNANSELIYVKCNQCMFDANHDVCFLEFVNDVNVRSKSKSAKRSKKKNIWKPTGQVFTDIGYRYDVILSHLSLVESVKDQVLVMASKVKARNTPINLKLKTQFKKSSNLFAHGNFANRINAVLEVVIKFLKMIQVSLNAIFRNIRTDNGTKFVNKTLKDYYEDVGISHQTSVARTPNKNGVCILWNRTLVEAARTMLIFLKAPLFLWAEAIAIACYTQNRSLICKCHNKTSYQLLNNKKSDLSYLHVFGSLCYPTNASKDLGQLKPKADIGIFIEIASEQFSSGPGPQIMNPGTLSSGLVPNPPYSTPYVPPINNDWDILFQPMFDEFLNPPPNVVSLVPVVVARRHDDSTGSPVSTSIDQDASSSISTRKQLKTDDMWCYFNAFLTSVKPKNFKEAMPESFWIEAMQEEIHEFERLQVWELVPCPDFVMLIKLKWIYKVKKDELGGVLKNKARLVAKGYRQEDGIDFEESFAPIC